MLFAICSLCILVFCIGIVFTVNRGRQPVTHLLLQIGLLFIGTVIYISYFLGFLVRDYRLRNVCLMGGLLGVIGLILLWRNRRRVLPALHLPRSRPPVPLMVILGLTAATLLLQLYLTLSLGLYDWDGLAYHSPNLVDYIQNGRITMVEKSLWSNVYPKNVEMLNMYVLVFFRSGFLIRLPQYMAVLVGGVSTYGVLRELGARRQTALMGGALLMTTPIYLAQITSLYVDTFLGSILICAIYFLLKYYRSPTLSNALFVGLALGVAVGIKYSAAAYAAILFVVFLIIAWKKRTLPVRAVAIGLCLTVSLGGVWYLFNWYATGNPLYPFEIGVGDFTLFAGSAVEDTVMISNVPEQMADKPLVLQWLTSWAELAEEGELVLRDRVTTKFDDRFGGFGFSWLFLLLPLFFIGLVHGLRKRRLGVPELIVLGIPVLMFLITPESWWTRYTCFIVIVGIWGFFYFTDRLCRRRWLRRTVNVLLVLLVAYNCASGSLYALDKLSETRENGDKLPTAYLREIYPIIDGEEPYSIASFRPLTAEEFYLTGSRTQNTCKWYSPNRAHCESLDGVNAVRDDDDIRAVLEAQDPDLVLISTGYWKIYVEYFENPDCGYTLIHEYDNHMIYAKQ